MLVLLAGTWLVSPAKHPAAVAEAVAPRRAGMETAPTPPFPMAADSVVLPAAAAEDHATPPLPADVIASAAILMT